MEAEQTVPSRRSLLSPIALVWAGTVIGGSLIAAPAKFQVEELTMPVALLVGRVQFTGLLIAELILIGLAIASLMFAKDSVTQVRRWTSALFAIAVVLFAVQQLALMPQLQSRSLRIIAGETVQQSGLHWIYIAVECSKVILLLLAGFLQESVVPREEPSPRK